MGAIMFIGTYGGYRLDKYCQNKIPVFTVTFALIAVASALYLTLKDFLHKKKWAKVSSPTFYNLPA